MTAFRNTFRLTGWPTKMLSALDYRPRLKLIYFGLIFLGSANILYRLRRPFIFRIGTDQFEYVDKALLHFTLSDYIDIHGAIRREGHHTLRGKYDDAEYEAFLDLASGERDLHLGGRKSESDWTQAKGKYEDLMRSMLIENFFRNNIMRRTSLTLCIILSMIGYVLLLVPSADLFFKVFYGEPSLDSIALVSLIRAALSGEGSHAEKE